MAKSLVGYLNSRNIKFTEDYDLSKISSIKVGGRARIFAEPASSEDIINLICYANQERVRYKVVGRLTNTLFANNYDGILISTLGLSGMTGAEGRFTYGSGSSLAASLAYAASLSYGGAEQLRLIPGSVGGAVFGNAGAHGIEISDIFESARVYMPDDGDVIEFSRDDMNFSYRYSRLKSSGGCVLDVTLRLTPKRREDIISDLEGYIYRRKSSQPALPSLGSVFKRVDGTSAGFYIERAGLKGVIHGGAAISSKHAGFIVNLGGASVEDIIALVELAKKRVHDSFGVTLEEEIEIL